jgi:hypothetical protein
VGLVAAVVAAVADAEAGEAVPEMLEASIGEAGGGKGWGQRDESWETATARDACHLGEVLEVQKGRRDQVRSWADATALGKDAWVPASVGLVDVERRAAQADGCLLAGHKDSAAGEEAPARGSGPKAGSIRRHPEQAEQALEEVAEVEERPTAELQVHEWRQVGMPGDERLEALVHCPGWAYQLWSARFGATGDAPLCVRSTDQGQQRVDRHPMRRLSGCCMIRTMTESDKTRR